ncbi:MAG: nucleoside triphosphate pyrophosphohydrolase [Gammaproteobacteria bacterium]|nr:MAG: nucleoside triphosphate pyrophosphohydrolase [Gammaproteobacteria bacterium]
MNRTGSEQTDAALAELLQIMARLRDPDGGCPWDLQQDFSSIAPYTLEEAYEVAEAIQRNDAADLCDELGDLLFQVVFHAQMAKERDWFDFADVLAAINRKLIRRHPHVFGDEKITDARAQTEAWEQHKTRERAAKGEATDSALDGVPLALPALVRAQKIQRRAACTGFDWDNIKDVVAKLDEELAELKQALAARESAERVQEELGDLIFSSVNLARFLDADAETLLRDASHKFESRFRLVEKLVQQERRELRDCTLDELEGYWQAAKKQLG